MWYEVCIERRPYSIELEDRLEFGMLSACNGIRSGPSVLGLDTVVRSCPIAQMCVHPVRGDSITLFGLSGTQTDTDRITRGETRATRAHTGSALEDGDDDNPQGGGSQAPRKSASHVPNPIGPGTHKQSDTLYVRLSIKDGGRRNTIRRARNATNRRKSRDWGD